MLPVRRMVGDGAVGAPTERITMTTRIAATTLASIAVLLAGCSAPADQDRAAPAPADGASDTEIAAPPPPAAPADTATKGGDGSPIDLATLTEADISRARMDGELGCSFAADAATSPILIARGNVATKDPARGIVKVGDTLESIAANGGYDAMARGTKFFAKGLELRIVLSGPAPRGGESPPRPAALRVDRADGAQRSFAGLWQCGP